MDDRSVTPPLRLRPGGTLGRRAARGRPRSPLWTALIELVLVLLIAAIAGGLVVMSQKRRAPVGDRTERLIEYGFLPADAEVEEAEREPGSEPRDPLTSRAAGERAIRAAKALRSTITEQLFRFERDRRAGAWADGHGEESERRRAAAAWSRMRDNLERAVARQARRLGLDLGNAAGEAEHPAFYALFSLLHGWPREHELGRGGGPAPTPAERRAAFDLAVQRAELALADLADSP